MSRRPSLTIVEAGEQMRQQVLVNHLTELRLVAFVDNYAACAQDATRGHWPYEHYLATLAEQEVDRRTQNRRKRRLQEARFPWLKTLDQFDFDFQPSLDRRQIRELAGLSFVARGHNVVILGPPGVGKTQPP